MSEPPAAAPLCPNCEAALTGAFCAQCGQEVRPLDPTLQDLVAEYRSNFLSLDGKTVQTLRPLFTRPGLLTQDHLAGRRARHVGPLRLYLLLSLFYFVASSFAPSNITMDGPRQPSGIDVLSPGEDPAGLHATLLRGSARAEADPAGFRRLFLSASSTAFFALLPVFAVAVRVVYLRTRRPYPQYIYFALHYQAAAFGALALASLAELIPGARIGEAAWAAALAWCAVYLAVALRRVWGGSWAAAAARAAAVVVLYGLCFTVAVLGSVYYTFYRIGAASGAVGP